MPQPPNKPPETPPGHSFDIVVNTRPHTVNQDELTFDDVVAIAVADGLLSGPQVVYTISYRRAHGNQAGDLAEGESVKLKDGIVFNVGATDKS